MVPPVSDFVVSTTRLLRRADSLVMPSVTTVTTDLPTLTDTANSYTTPSISVPSLAGNPYIIRNKNLSGTVFIAVGAIVLSIILGFVLYHFIVSFAALRMAKRLVAGDRSLYEKYQSNNSTAYGALPLSTSLPLGSDYSKLPFLLQARSGFGGSTSGDASTIYGSEAGGVSKHDLTRMFISPTAEVMQHKRVKSSHGMWPNPGSSTASQLNGSGSVSVLGGPSNRNSQTMPMYMMRDTNNSDSSLQVPSVGTPLVQTSSPNTGRQPRKTIPSVYLEDLMGGSK